MWPADHWDSGVRRRIRGRRFELAPLLSRVQNVGAEGGAARRTVAQYLEFQHTCAWIGAFAGEHVPPYWESALSSVLDEIIMASDFLYCRLGHDQRLLHLLPGGHIGAGAAICERSWHFEAGDRGGAVLVIRGMMERPAACVGIRTGSGGAAGSPSSGCRVS